VAEARDGHGFVADALETAPRASLPVWFLPLGGRLVVFASATEDVPVGAVVTAIDGASAEGRLAESASLFSGSDRWRTVRAASELAQCPSGSRVSLTVETGKGTRAVVLACDRKEPLHESRPDKVVELEPALWYVDLTRASMRDVAPCLEEIAAAHAVVFDVRGYPLDAGLKLLPHLLDAPESGRFGHTPRVVGPFGRFAGWSSGGWDLAPAKPRVAGKVVFLTDARAISYAESVMLYVADLRLGTIVGSATAGTNGNVASITTPGRFAVGFTGARVTRHDGTTPFHLAGVAPDVPCVPTVEGLRAGRDEVLEKGLAVARAGAP
jgi:C-terminal processing protease CtpA/Prc